MINRLRQNQIAKTFLSLLPAFLFASMTAEISNLVIGLLIGNLMGPVAITAAGLVSPILRLFITVSMVFTGGFRICCGRFMGRGELQSIQDHFTSAVLCLLAVGGLLTVIGVCFADPIVSLLGAKDEIRTATAAYLRGISLGAIPTILVPLLMVACQMNNRGKRVLIASGLQAAVTFAVGFAVMKALPGNLFTAGLSTVAGLLAAGLFLWGRRPIVDGKFRMEAVRRMFRTGLSDAALQFASMVTCVIFNGLALKYGGAAAVAAITVRGYVLTPANALGVAMGQTGSAMISVAVGEGDRNVVRKNIHAILILSVVIMQVLLLPTVLLRGPLAMLFGAEGQTLIYAKTFLFASFFCLSVFPLILTVSGAYQAMGAVWMSSVCNLSTEGILSSVLSIVMTSLFGLNGLWWAYAAVNVIFIVFLFIFSAIRLKKWPRGLTGVTDWVKIETPDASIRRTLAAAVELSACSVELQSFLREQGIDEKRALFSTLCTEEMCANVIRHGFPLAGNRKDLAVQVFASVKDGQVTVRIRDNAVPFDPMSKMKLHTEDPDDPGRNIGIRVVTRLAKEMTYQSIFGMNVVTIKM